MRLELRGERRSDTFDPFESLDGTEWAARCSIRDYAIGERRSDTWEQVEFRDPRDVQIHRRTDRGLDLRRRGRKSRRRSARAGDRDRRIDCCNLGSERRPIDRRRYGQPD